MLRDTINVGFLGTGWMGSALLGRLAQREDVRLVAIHDVDRAKAETSVKTLGLTSDILVDDYQTILENPEVNTVFLCTPNAHHGRQAIEAMEAGKHVFCEKPCATSFAEFRREIELDQARPDLVTFVDYILNFDQTEQRFHNMLSDGLLGTITQIQINYRHTINAAGDKAWKLRRETVGDALGMGVIHAISAIVTAMRPQAAPVEVFATSLALSEMGYDVDPIWNIQLRFDSGAAGFCFGNIDKTNGYDAYHNVYGTGGAFIFDSLVERPRQVRYWSSGVAGGKWIYPLDRTRCRQEGNEKLAWPDDVSTPSSGNVIEHQTGACIDHFVECVRSGNPSPFGFAGSRTIPEVGWAAIMSAAEDRPIRLPLDEAEAETFFVNHSGVTGVPLYGQLEFKLL